MKDMQIERQSVWGIFILCSTNEEEENVTKNVCRL